VDGMTGDQVPGHSIFHGLIVADFRGQS
jgi:hypothetical protein